MIKNAIETVHFSPGQLSFKERDTSADFYIIQSGVVEVFKESSHGEEIHLASVTEGTSLGEFAMLDAQPRSASARAKTDVVCARVSAEAYKQLIEELPDWAISVMQSLVERLRGTNEIVQKLLSELKTADQKLKEKTQLQLDSAEFTNPSTSEEAVSSNTITDIDFSSLSETTEPSTMKFKKT